MEGAGTTKCIEILETERFLKKKVRIGERGSVRESILYRKKDVRVLESHIKMYQREKTTRLRTV